MKFSIVTPAYNSGRYIRETIESVAKQRGNFSIEYFVLDNHSTDDTCNIVQQYQRSLASGKIAVFCNDIQLHLVSEQDSGMYDAIKAGFSRATGDIYAWINSDDIYLPGAFDIVQRTLEKYPQISWIKGITSYINENSTMFSSGQCFLYRQDFIKAGLYGPALHFIQQDSVFWRKELWLKSGGVNDQLSLAGDYFLWKSFSQFEPLYSLKAFVSCFRQLAGQKSSDIQAYYKEIDNICPLDKHVARKFKRYFLSIESLPRFLRPLMYRLAFGHYKHHLVTLDKGLFPALVEGEYFLLKELT
jgi:glycosyltransferase involved in cell wall biosynthesis